MGRRLADAGRLADTRDRSAACSGQAGLRRRLRGQDQTGREMKNLRCTIAFVLAALFGGMYAAAADDHDRLLRLDHYVGVRSTVPAIAGQMTPIYVREVVLASTALRTAGSGNRIALFVHGAGTPSEVAFDVPYQDYSWMEYLAQAGFDVFAMDTTGYGRSTRPAAMNDPCNLSPAQQLALAPDGHVEVCSPTYGQQMTTIASDWNDIAGVVDYLRALRGATKVSMLAWSLGGPRAGGYAAQNPDKVARLVLLAPAYSRSAAAKAPTPLPAAGAAMNSQSYDDLTALWNRQVGCPDQYEESVKKAVWRAMLEFGPGRGDLGRRRAARPQCDELGLDHRGGVGDADSDLDGHRCRG